MQYNNELNIYIDIGGLGNHHTLRSSTTRWKKQRKKKKTDKKQSSFRKHLQLTYQQPSWRREILPGTAAAAAGADCGTHNSIGSNHGFAPFWPSGPLPSQFRIGSRSERCDSFLLRSCAHSEWKGWRWETQHRTGSADDAKGAKDCIGQDFWSTTKMARFFWPTICLPCTWRILQTKIMMSGMLNIVWGALINLWQRLSSPLWDRGCDERGAGDER